MDYRSDELFYLPRNLRSHRVYGYSPVEQVVMTVNIALRRQLHQLQYYTEGNVPEALIGVPETWSPDQIGQFQNYWDALLEGDTAQRRHARFVPATISKSFVQTKDAGLKDDYDEWLARIVCFAFSVSPQALVRAMNRATAETAHDQALQEGLLPLMRWVKELVDRTLSEGFGYHDLEFAWQESNDLDALTQAKIAQVYLAAGVLTPQEVRASLGLGNEQKGGAANAGRPFGKLFLPPDQSGVGGGKGGNPYHDEKGRFTNGPEGGEDGNVEAILVSSRHHNGRHGHHHGGRAISEALDKVMKSLEEIFGDAANFFRNKHGDPILMNKDGDLKFRGDLNDPSPHKNPHMHLEKKGEKGWEHVDPDRPRIYPSDVEPE